MQGMMPITQEYSHNVDFSTFPLVVSSCYDQMKSVDGTLAKKLPYCAFLHHCTVAAVATMIDVAQSENQQNEFNFDGSVKPILDDHVLPSPISDYLGYVTKVHTHRKETLLELMFLWRQFH